MRTLLLTAAFVLSISGVAADKKIDDQVVLVSDQDKDMNAAIAHAQSTLDSFLELSEKPPFGASNFKVKVMFSDKNGAEHFWVTPFKKSGNEFVGVVANEAQYVTSIEIGKTYRFSREQITDWGYQQGNKQVGSFTVCVLFKTMPKDIVARYKQDHGFDCET
ncbi:YegJ family protein [Chitinimonas sp. BJYL2]|uniref:YegJ family protein n=1 Tax=Chitinimonas sp. BJYL2 TaxID=2976696 RepID=UPI0022B51F73|nr:DUF2314 domain-containing protein [Chitinimonas sp. BJYL2]